MIKDSDIPPFPNVAAPFSPFSHVYPLSLKALDHCTPAVHTDAGTLVCCVTIILVIFVQDNNLKWGVEGNGDGLKGSLGAHLLILGSDQDLVKAFLD